MPPPHFTDPQVTAIVTSAYASSILNFMGSLFTITTYLAFKESRNYGTSLIFHLALSDFCTAFANVVLVFFVHAEDNLVCKIQASMLIYGLCASMLWGFLIGFHLFLVLYNNLELDQIRKYRVVFHLIAWGYPLFVVLIAAAKSKWAWCFLPDPYRMLLFFPDTIVFFLLVIIYCLLWFKIRRVDNSASREICRKMSLYLLVYAMINVFGIVNRVQDYFYPKNIFVLYLLQFIFEPLQGFLNAIAYVWNEPAFIDQYKRLFTKCTTQHVKTISIQAEQERLMSMVTYDQEDP